MVSLTLKRDLVLIGEDGETLEDNDEEMQELTYKVHSLAHTLSHTLTHTLSRTHSRTHILSHTLIYTISFSHDEDNDEEMQELTYKVLFPLLHHVQGYLAHKKRPPPWVHHSAIGIGLL